jgi:hypothetical protein
MNNQRLVGRHPYFSWSPFITLTGFDRLAAVAANTFAWMIIVKLVFEH